MQVRRNAIAVAEPQEVGDLLGVDEVVGVDGRGHGMSLRRLTDSKADGTLST